MLFRFDIGARARSASRLIGDVRSDIIRALVREKLSKGTTQQQLADKLGVSRAELNSRLAGKDELTLRSIADLAWALDKEIVFELKEPEAAAGQNYPAETSTAAIYSAKRAGNRADAVPSSSGGARTFFARQAESDRD